MSGEENETLVLEGRIENEVEDVNTGVILNAPLSYRLDGNQLTVALEISVTPTEQNTRVEGLQVESVILEHNNINLEGIKENDSWTFQLPDTYTPSDSPVVIPTVSFRLIAEDGAIDEFRSRLQYELEGREQIPTITFFHGLSGCFVMRNQRKQFRYGTFSSVRNSSHRIGSGEQRMFEWESLREMTDEDFQNIAVLAGAQGLFENTVFSTEDVGREWLNDQFNEMDSSGQYTRVYHLNELGLIVASNMRNGLEFVLPQPGENYRSAEVEADKLFDDRLSAVERATAAAGMFGYAVFVVVDFVPGVGKADDAVRAVRQGDEVVENVVTKLDDEVERLRSLSNRDDLSEGLRDTYARTADELEENASELRQLSEELDDLAQNPGSIPMDQAEELQETLRRAENAREHQRRTSRQLDVDVNRGPSSTVNHAKDRARAAETVTNIMSRNLSPDEGRRLWREFVENNQRIPGLKEDAVIEYLEHTGKLTEEGIQQFGRQANSLHAEEGVTRLNDLLDLGRRGPSGRDAGHAGKVWEDTITEFVQDNTALNLNDIDPNFRVVDLLSMTGRVEDGLLYSVARGRREYLVKKLKKLFNLIDDETENFRTMLRRLSEEGILPQISGPLSADDYRRLQDEFVERARLMVPEDAIDPLRAYIWGRDDWDPHLRERMMDAITSEIR